MPRENLPETATKTVLVTGAMRGLGLAIATRLVSDGYQVVGVARCATEAFSQLAGAGRGGSAHFVACDLEQTEGLHDLVKQIVKAHGKLYALVNNAGIGLDGVLATMHARDIERVLRINLHAPIHLIKYAARSMLQRGEGRIVNVSSIIARTGFNGLSVYAASKAGLEGLSRSLARAGAGRDHGQLRGAGLHGNGNDAGAARRAVGGHRAPQSPGPGTRRRCGCRRQFSARSRRRPHHRHRHHRRRRQQRVSGGVVLRSARIRARLRLPARARMTGPIDGEVRARTLQSGAQGRICKYRPARKPA